MTSDITVPMMVYSIPSEGFVPATLISDNGSALVASYLLKEGFNPLIRDYQTPGSMKIIKEYGGFQEKDRFRNHVVDEQDETIKSNGVKLFAAKLSSNGFLDNMRICRELKKRNTGLKVVAHGPHANWYARQILQFYPDSVDFVSVGDGETSAAPLVKYAYGYGDLEDVPNIWYIDNSGEVKETKRGKVFVDINDLPHATYDPEIYRDIDEKILLPMPDGGRGCPYGQCIFCAQPVHMGKFRERDVEKTLADIEQFQKELGVHTSRLPDSSPRSRWINKYLEGLPAGHKTSFFARAGGDYDFDLMEDKVTAMFVGMESVRDDILWLYKKTNNPKKFKKDGLRLLEKSRDRGIGTTMSMIVPSMWETDDTAKANLEFVEEANPDFCAALPIGVLSGTPLEAMILEGQDMGIRFEKDYDDHSRRMMEAELDLSKLDINIPYEVMINGEHRKDLLDYTMKKFSLPLMEKGIFHVSDENVTIADMVYGGLSKDQKERRKQVIGLSSRMRDAGIKLDYEDMGDIVNTANRNKLDKQREG